MGIIKMEGKRKKRGKASKAPLVKSSTLRAIVTNVILFLVVAAYCALGAYLLILIEKPYEEEKALLKYEGKRRSLANKEYLVDDAWHKSSLELNESDFKAMMAQNLNLFKKSIVRLSTTHYFDGEYAWTYDWTFTKSLLFTVTTVGAIGYGHIKPTTEIGQLFTIYYAMCGIPLLLLFLANIGSMMGKSLKFIYSRLCCRWCRARRKLAEWKGSMKKIPSRAVSYDDVGLESYMPTDLTEVPIMVNLVVITVYLVLGGIYFTHTESWELHESVYFCFITLTTIGFGDYVPGRTFYDSDENLTTLILTLTVTIFYCIFGMALVSMAINLMQEQIVQKARWMASEVGIIEEDYDPIERYNIKRANEDNMLVTPSARDGNRRQSNMLLNADDDFNMF